MNDSSAKPSILLIDDKEEVLDGLHRRLLTRLPEDEVSVQTWVPSDADIQDPKAAFEARVDENTTLVVTDYDLTTKVKGFFGVSVVAWCQKELIPVGDYSRRTHDALPKEPDLFELRVPPNDEDGSAHIASLFRGFRAIRIGLSERPDLYRDRQSLSAVLAGLLNREQLDSQFALYMSKLGTANPAIIDTLRVRSEGDGDTDARKARLLTYVLGHVLLNAILKYPGPIVEERALCAYVGTSNTEAEAIRALFEGAAYDGPFGDGVRAYWRESVDRRLDELGPVEADVESIGAFHRLLVEQAIGRPLAHHGCDRCGGVNGGYWCPFTQRPVCELPTCSVGASSLIPEGAQLARVERDFYDEWAPMVGL